jgi:hypothetical protein
MSQLTKEEKIQVMRQAADIACSVSSTTRLMWDVNSIQALVTTLYTKMTQLIEEEKSPRIGPPHER